MLSTRLSLIGLIAGAVFSVQAQFAPLSLTPESYNYDVVVEKGALQPPAPATTATLDAGTNNTANTFYEQGFNPDSPSSGLPPADTTFTSESLPDHNYTLPASYTTNNAILVDPAVSNATFTVTAPIAVSSISLLAASGGGATTLNYTVHHADNSIETNSIVVPDWFGGANQALTLNGRADAVSRAFANVDSGNPRLYSVDIALSNTTSPVTSIDFQLASGTGHVGIFAVSSSTGGDYSNLPGTGYKYDMVIEATAEPARTGLGATTASLDAGAANTGASWYEIGYNHNAPTTGIPGPGQTLTNASASDHVFRMAPNFTAPDAIVVDNANSAVTITPSSPSTASGLSFLGSSGNGAVTIGYTIHHVDGNDQTGTLVLPDWFNGTPFAYVANGRVNVVNAGFSAVNSNNPRLYSVDVAVDDTASPVTSVDLNWVSGNGHAVIMAVAASAGAVKPIIDQQPASKNVLEGGSVTIGAQFSGTPPLTFRWQSGTNGNFVNLTDNANVSGSTTTNLTLSNISTNFANDYWIIATSSAGSTTSRVARLNIVSTKTDVTQPGDSITIVGGSAPTAESVDHAIDNDTQKYLNFGLDGDQNAGFTGPVGFTVTPSGGSSVLTGLRVYTANDAPERDPIDYKLEGSNDDGATFTTIASGPLNLPDDRNAAGQSIDPIALVNQEIRFANAGGYTSYRVTFTHVKNDTTANSLQVGEVELLGDFGAGAPTLSVTYNNTNGTITITSSQPGTLQSTTSLDVPVNWTSEGPINGAFTINNTGSMKFFRVLMQ